ncbi:MAG TPA: GntR family transcriptional regulator, partial [Anaerolineales bacterium]|nr:GntR family transcriptional regulator [Anaerolineales bacterium]
MEITHAEQAYRYILQKIVTNDLKPGIAIAESVLMEEFQLGRTPVREALKRLQVEQYVTFSPRRGIFVNSLAAEDIQQVLEIQMPLELLGIRLAARRITEEQLAILEQHVRSTPETSTLSPENIADLDINFHILIYRASHNPLLRNDLRRYFYMSQRILYHLGLPFTLDLLDHQAILGALQAGDENQAEASLRSHLTVMHT